MELIQIIVAHFHVIIVQQVNIQMKIKQNVIYVQQEHIQKKEIQNVLYVQMELIPIYQVHLRVINVLKEHIQILIEHHV